MEVGVVKVADDQDFEKLKQLLDNHNGWKLDYSKEAVKVWTKSVVDTSFKMIKVWTTFTDVVPLDLYDVLHDPDYRRVWDLNMIESHDIGYLNPNNDVGYYAMSCPAPLKNRDFVLQRSWLDTGQEQYIINHSVHHKNYPPRKEYVRATSYLTGFLIRPSSEGTGSMLGYVSQTDPHGTLPPWLVNKCTQILAPKMVKKLYKASRAYADWKKINNPNFKPWHFPEQITSPRISIQEKELKQTNKISCEGKSWENLMDNCVIPDAPRREALATFRLTTGHDCLAAHLHNISILPSPECVLCHKSGTIMNSQHLKLCSKLVDCNSDLTTLYFGSKKANDDKSSARTLK